MAKKALLMILDGWGIGKHGKGDVIYNTPTPYLDLLTATSAHSQLQASGEDVGLPDGQMGNSEVGHLNIGAGRIVYQDLVKINRACKDNSIVENPQVKAAYTYAKENNKKLHLMGLCSDGGVHSSLDHLFKLIEVGKHYGLKNQTFVHCFMDGRDTDPKSGKGFIEQVQQECQKNDAAIASIVGRFYAMDRDKRWERVKEAYDLLVKGEGKQSADMVQAMQESYDEGVTDEFVKPIHNASVNGLIEEGDVIIFINFRNDRAKELTIVLTQQDMEAEGMKTIPNLQYYCMTPYDASFQGVHILFPKENVEDTLGEYLSRQGKKQLHTAETEKYAHVTFFSNESGMGSAPIVAAAAKTRNPVRQALVSSTGTFWDTVIICALTGMVLVSSILAYPDITYADGAALTKVAFSKIPYIGAPLLTFGILTFAFSTILGWSYYGESAVNYIEGRRINRFYRILYIVALFFGSIINLDIIWNIADCMNALMAIPNLVCLLLLSKVVAQETNKYLWGNHLDDEMEEL